MKFNTLTKNFANLNPNAISCAIGNNLLGFHRTTDSDSTLMNKMMIDDTFNVSWDENDMVQVQEDEWISSVIGTEEEAIYDVLAEIN